ncbi:MAG: hypothetical protein ABSH51_03625 [Solirubrobacteraceae bacterium]|jgi:hypothetical protein
MRRILVLRARSLWLLALSLTIALVAVPASASAQSGGAVQSWDPQTTNVPYLAWAGEEIRLNKCFASDVTSASTSLSAVRAEFLVEDWSATSQAPQVEQPTVDVYYSTTLGEVCAKGDVVSLYPGMSRVELDIADPTGVLGTAADPYLKHQFLAGWMTINDPTLTEMASTDFPASAQPEAASELGDPTGNGEFNAGGNGGYLDVKITGSMPMTGAWASLVGESTVTLPNDWVTLAHALAADANPADTAPWNTWDIAGDSTGLEGHVAQTPACSPLPAQFAGIPVESPGPNSYTSALDNGDDCTGGGADGPFSTVFGTLSGAGTSIGPFDPLDPGDTLLSDGNLSSQDAPMPAARIDVSIAPNSGAATDTSGVGYLAPADKTKTYSRDFLGFDGVPGNEYAPFYDAYIPATSRPGDASSGIDGGIANNFAGFLVDGEYHFWDFAATLASNAGAATACLERAAGGDPQSDSFETNPSDYYQTPSGPSTVAVYTDQNGEAQVQYEPGTGFYFNSLINQGGAVLNADGGCDLQSLYNVPDSLGTASITATVRYPFKPVDYPALTSAPVSKSVTSLWSKTLAYFPKGTGAANANSRIVVAHAQNIDGTPFAGEVVCFSSDAEAMTSFDGTVNGIDLSGSSPAADPKGSSIGRVCVTTDDNGNAAVEVLESQSITVDVIADFTAEGILRDLPVDYTTPGSSGGTPPPAPGTAIAPAAVTTSGSPASSASPASTGTTAPTSRIVSAVDPAIVTTTPTIKKITTRIMLLRLVSPARGQHYVLLRVTASSKTVRVLLTLVGRGKRLSTKVVRIRTNRSVKVDVTGAVRSVKRVYLLS